MVTRLAMRRGSGGGGGGGSSDDDDGGSSRGSDTQMPWRRGTPGDDDEPDDPDQSVDEATGGDRDGTSSDRYQGYNTPGKEEQITGGSDDQVRAYTDDDSSSTVDQGTAQAGDVTMDVTADAGDGFFEITVEMNGTVNAGFRDLSVPDNTVDVTMSFEGPASNAGLPPQVYGAVENQVQKVQGLLGQFPTGLPQNPREVITGDMRPLPSLSLPLRVDLFGQKLTGSRHVSGSVRVPKNGSIGKFPVITTPNTNFNVSSLPPIKIRVTAKPKGGLKNVLGNVASTVVQIPASTFIEEMSIDEFSCAELYPDIDAKLDEIPQNVDRKVELAKEQAQKLQNLRDQVTSALSDFGTIDNIDRNVLRSAMQGDSNSNVQEAVQAIREAKNISPHRFQVATWQGALTEAEEKLSNVELNRCNGDFTNRISNARDRIASVDQYQSTINDLYHQLRTIEIPDPTENLPDVPCAEEFSDVASHIETLQGRLGEVGSGAKFELPPTPEDLQLIRNQIQNRKDLIKERTDSGSKCRNQFMGHITDIENRINNMGTRTPEIPISECSNEFNNVHGIVQDVENEAGIFDKGEMNIDPRNVSLDPSEIDLSLQQFISRANNARAVVRNNVPADSPCFNHFMNRIDTVEEKVSTLDWTGGDDDEDDEDDGIDKPEPPELDCSDVPKSLRNRVASIEGAAEQWTGKRQVARKEKRKRELLSELGGIETNIQDQVDGENPCKDKLLSRLQQSRDQLLSTGTRPTTAVPCEDRFPDVGTKVENFEDDVINLRPPVTPEQIQEFAQRGNELADQIEETIPSDDPCRADMAERVRDLTNRVDKLTSQVRIQASADPGEQQQRDEMLQQLTEALNRISAGR